jgi:hypothetical protein
MKVRFLAASALLPFGLLACPEPKPPPILEQAPIERADAGTPPVLEDPVPEAPAAITAPSARPAPATGPPTGADCQRYVEHYAALVFKDRGEGPWEGKPLPPGWQPGGVMLGIRDQCSRGDVARTAFDCAMAADTLAAWMKCVQP